MSHFSEQQFLNMKRIALATYSLSLIVALTAASLAQSLSLFGSVRRSGDAPLVGAKLYLRQGSGHLVGPALSDSYGRYAFYDIIPGRYHLVVYVADVPKWEGDVTVPGNLVPIVIP